MSRSPERSNQSIRRQNTRLNSTGDSATPQGAAGILGALDCDHDGSVMDDLMEQGGAILGSLLADRRSLSR